MSNLSFLRLFRCTPILCGLLLAGSSYRAFPQSGETSITIVAPTDGAVFSAPADILISADVKWSTNFPHLIYFYEGTNRIAFFLLDPGPTNFNIEFTWTNVPVGDYTLTVVGGGSEGSVTSAPVNVSVIGAANPPVVSIVATDPIAVEGTNYPWFPPTPLFGDYCSGTNTATFLVHRNGGTNSDLTVYYAISGTASNGVDYATIPDHVTIPAGKRFALVTIIPLDDVDPTPRRFDTVVLSLEPPPDGAPPSYVVGFPDKAAAIILEDIDLPGPPPCVLPDGCFQAAWPATNGTIYSLQTSTNLADWVSLCTNMVVKGSIHFVDPDACGFTNRFYRATPAAGLPPY